MSDPTGLWVFTQRWGSKLGLLLVGCLLFIAGWMTGRTMSPYYAASPIVFDNDSQAACVSTGGSPEALAELREAGQAIITPEQLEPSAAAAQTSAPAVTSKTFVASKNSNLYHHVSCPSANRIKEENKLWFSTHEEAEKAGYSASACTKEKLGI